MIAIIDYGMGNLHSVSKAVERLGFNAQVTADEAEIIAAQGVILPGVGAFGDAMSQLRQTGLDAVVKQVAANDVPLLGICLGMQLLFEASEEHGWNNGLGLLEGKVIRFRGDYKVPHMGWNRLQFTQEHPIFQNVEEGHVYFVHSYHAQVIHNQDLLAVTDYYQPVTSIVGRGNVLGMQFHPEKSGSVGLHLLRNFLQSC